MQLWKVRKPFGALKPKYALIAIFFVGSTGGLGGGAPRPGGGGVRWVHGPEDARCRG